MTFALTRPKADLHIVFITAPELFDRQCMIHGTVHNYKSSTPHARTSYTASSSCIDHIVVVIDQSIDCIDNSARNTVLTELCDHIIMCYWKFSILFSREELDWMKLTQ